MNEWKDLFVATSGAAAALTGLIFVGVSISLHKILSTPKMTNRALISLILLLSILINSLLLLVPVQSLYHVGIKIIFLGLATWGFISFNNVQILRSKEKRYRNLYIFNIVIDQIAALSYIVSGTLIALHGEEGLYWIVTAMTFSFIKSTLDAWVLLVEINR